VTQVEPNLERQSNTAVDGYRRSNMRIANTNTPLSRDRSRVRCIGTWASDAIAVRREIMSKKRRWAFLWG